MIPMQIYNLEPLLSFDFTQPSSQRMLTGPFRHGTTCYVGHARLQQIDELVNPVSFFRTYAGKIIRCTLQGTTMEVSLEASLGTPISALIFVLLEMKLTPAQGGGKEFAISSVVLESVPVDDCSVSVPARRVCVLNEVDGCSSTVAVASGGLGPLAWRVKSSACAMVRGTNSIIHILNCILYAK